MSIQDYEHPALTADVVLLAIGAAQIDVLLVQRGRPPFEDAWAFPGGFVEVGESPMTAASRELREETGIQGLHLVQLRAFGAPGRDPRGHVVTVAYLAVVATSTAPKPSPGSDAVQASWWPIEDLPVMAFDHAEILNHGLRRLQASMDCPSATRDPHYPIPAGLSEDDVQAACLTIAATLNILP